MYKLVAIISLFCLTTGASIAEEFVITQKDLKFSKPLKVVHPGDKVIFTNEDNVAHNIVSLTADYLFDLGVLPSGASKSVTFKDPGVVDIQCTIHPNMKMTMFVFN